MFNLNNLKFSAKITLLGIISVLFTALALLLVVAWQSSEYNAEAQRKVDEVTNSSLKDISRGIYNLVQAQGESVQNQVDSNLNVARYVLARTGQPSFSQETIHWDAINQFTQQATSARLPKMLVGGKWLGQIVNLDAETLVVDEIVNLVGGTATIFQRMNEQGDMLRVATNVPNADGLRAIGTYIPASNPDGTPNPVISAILKGERYHGVAFVVNAWYITAYEPMVDDTGALVGMLYVGVKQESIESLRQAIYQTRLGKSGYVYVLGGQGEGRGHYIISQGGLRDGENVWTLQDAAGGYVIQSIVARALMKPGEITDWRYLWQESDEPAPRWKIVQISYYEPWDWVIVAEVYEDELEEYQLAIQNGRLRMLGASGVMGLGIALVIGLISFGITRSMTRPLQQLTAVAEQIAGGDLTLSARIEQKDEVGILAQAFNSMTKQLRESIRTLEQRVADRTRDLERRSAYQEASAQVSRAVTSILEPEPLIKQIVELIRGQFDLYHTALFLLDPTGQWAEYRAGSGETGRQILMEGLRLAINGRSMTGKCISSAKACIAQDVRTEKDRVDHPLLTETRSEATLPLIARGRVIGALSAQSALVNAFDPNTIAVLQNMVDQVAVALDNARLFAESQQALEAERRAYGRVGREAWIEMLKEGLTPGYRYANDQVSPASDVWHPEMDAALQMGRSVVRHASGGAQTDTIYAAPIKVRGQTIGVLDLHKDAARGQWTPEEIALLETLTDQLGVALDSARLFEETQRRAAREQTINTITAAIRGTPAVDIVLQRTVEELGRAFGTSRASIRLDVSQLAQEASERA